MSVLQRKELEDSPLADLHAIASELGIEGYRGLRKDDLIAAILDVQGGDPGGNGGAPATAEPAGEIEDAAEPEEAEDRTEVERESEPDTEAKRDRAEDEQHETATGTLDVLSNGSGFLRRDDGADVYVSPAQIRRCELRAGDQVAGPVRSPRRNERHPSLVRVESVNGGVAEPIEQRPRFDDLTPVHVSERLAAPVVLEGAPFGKGSRVAIAGPSGAGATRLLRDVIAALKDQPGDISITVVLAGARPEEVTDWRRDAGVPVLGGSFDGTADEQAQAVQLAVERAKRVVERGGDAIVAIDSLGVLAPDLARRLFGAGRKLEEGGSLTVIAAVGEGAELLRLASTRVVLEPAAGELKLAADHSGAQRADLLG